MLVGVLQGYVSSRRRRQRRIAELVALVEELDQQATRVREEWLRLQPESELLSERTDRTQNDPRRPDVLFTQHSLRHELFCRQG